MPTLLVPVIAGVSNGSGGGGAMMPFWPHFVRWIGHFHPAITAFPIALLLAAALAELFRLWRGNPWLAGASRWCVIVGAITAVITVLLGWAFALTHGSSEILEIHRWLGTAAGVGAVVIWFLSEMSRRPNRTGWLIAFRTLLFIAVPLILATGYVGGRMVFGPHEYDWNRPMYQQTTHAVASSQPTSPSAGAIQVIDMTSDDTFKPANMTIKAGTTVQWKNISKDTHTATDDPAIAAMPDDVSMPAGAAAFNSKKVRPGKTFEHTFTVPGTYKYICEPHEMMGMKAELVVTAN